MQGFAYTSAACHFLTTLFMLTRLPYSLLWLLALPVVLLRLWWRGRRQPGYRQHLAERLGRYRQAAPAQLLWVHAVSVGETRAAQPLVEALLAAFPEHSVLLTHMTPTGRETSAQLFGDQPRVLRAYLPYDLAPFIAGFLRHFRPQLGIIMETELWPNLLADCRQAGIPTLLANARLSARSAARYARLPALSALTLGALRMIAAQTTEDARRLQALGAQEVAVTGNIKFDIEPPPTMIELGEVFRQRCGPRPLVLAASTREGEESLLLDAFVRQAPADALLLLVPRHPQRFAEVAALVTERQLTLQRRSDDAPVAAETRVWLGDSMGEMFAYYHAADVALIGGSWLAFGGQNLIEACAVGTPVLIGPHTFNFSAVAEQAIAAKAALRLADAEAGMQAAFDLLADTQARQTMTEAGREFARSHRGATARTLALVQQLLAPQR